MKYEMAGLSRPSCEMERFDNPKEHQSRDAWEPRGFIDPLARDISPNISIHIQ